MIQRIIITLMVALVVTACGAAAPVVTEAPTATEEIPAATEPPAFQSLEPPTRQPTVEETSTSAPTPTQVLPTQTDTPLPTLELPTEAVNAPVRMVWDGVPTYLGDSEPGYSFRVTYDPDLWALTTDQMGLNDAFEHRRVARPVPRPLRVDDGDRAAFAHP